MVSVEEAVAIASKVEGWMQLDELRWLAEKASTRKTILELGSWKGRSTKALALSSPGTVYAVDHWKGSESERQGTHKEAAVLGPDAFYKIFEENLKDEIRSGKVIPIRADSREAARRLREEKGVGWIDMVFIDGDHEYEPVKQDIRTWFPFVAPGGLFCGHDYFNAASVRQAVSDLIPYHVEGAIWSYVVPELDGG